MQQRLIIQFHDGRLGAHDLFGTPIAPGRYVVPADSNSRQVAQQCADAKLATVTVEDILEPEPPQEQPAAPSTEEPAPSKRRRTAEPQPTE